MKTDARKGVHSEAQERNSEGVVKSGREKKKGDQKESKGGKWKRLRGLD